ncbi:sensor histidine kinase [Larkinella rosea]|uniref:histidine kinase n=1 Tax=Larkinella rosea TaxID=2025312 RepID=A0A3P1C0X1_9BACT|nr:PAS domain-containing sensor histidine kinase [Larkinella rosea]RRB06912.1 PAS domain-containing sensor histidine kinase [Larkinella rosea]
MLKSLFAESLVDLLFEKSDDFIAIFDLSESKYIRVNQAGVRMLGFASEQALLDDPIRSRSLRNNELDKEYRSSLIDQLVEEGSYEETIQIKRQDGSLFWGRLKTTTFTNRNRPFSLIRVIDQERLHQAEHELEHSIQRNKAIFSNATIGIIVCDQQGRIVSANQMAETIFGYTTTEWSALTIEQLVPRQIGQYHEKLRHSFNLDPQVRAMGHNRDLNARRKDGSVFPVEVSLSYFRLDEELYAVAYIIDITIKKETERQLLTHQNHIEQLNADLEQKVTDRTQALLSTLEQLENSKDELAKALAIERELGDLKSRFVSMASHEFRTPLTVVMSSATLIERYTTSEQNAHRQKHLDRIKVSVNHLNDILEEFLSLGKLEEGKVTAHAVEVDFRQLMNEIVADLQATLKPGQVIESSLSCPDLIRIDSSLLRKILVNLLSNAVKYSGPGSTVFVRVHCEENERQLRLSIKDQGMGISKEDQEHLFERFFRAANVTDISGTGLGLHIVGRYVELMGGELTLQSELNQGTTVTLTLPYENHSPN